MSLLETLSPAQNLLIRDKGQTKWNDLLKITLLDLILKDVLVFVEVTDQPHPRDKARKRVYVQPGPAFSTYQPQDHERVFLAPYHHDTGVRYLIRNLVKLAYEDARRPKDYIDRVANASRSKGLWHLGIRRAIGGFGPTDLGKATRMRLMGEIHELNRDLRPLLSAGDANALDHLRRYGGSVLLIGELPLSMLPNFDANAFKHHRRHGDNPTSNGTGCGSGCGGVSSKQFESSFDQAAKGGSGCGGDAGTGCGGCSGCGGCGGCGA